MCERKRTCLRQQIPHFFLGSSTVATGGDGVTRSSDGSRSNGDKRNEGSIPRSTKLEPALSLARIVRPPLFNPKLARRRRARELAQAVRSRSNSTTRSVGG